MMFVSGLRLVGGWGSGAVSIAVGWLLRASWLVNDMLFELGLGWSPWSGCCGRH